MTGQLMNRTSRRAGLGGVAAAVAVLGLAVPAWAYYSVGSTNATAAGRAATLGTPTASTSNVTSSSVTITVGAPTGGLTPTGYRVARTSPTADANVCTIAGAAGSCNDTAPVSGRTNDYAVYAVLSGTTWQSPVPGTASAAVPSADSAPPVTAASQSPAANGAGWNKSDVTVTLAATDASGVAGTWYTTDGSTPTTSSTAYSAPFAVTSTATVKFFSRDTLGNTEPVQSLSLKIDKVAPTVSITSPAASSYVTTARPPITGTAGDAANDSSTVTIRIFSGSGSTGTPVQTLSATRSGATWTATPPAGLADGVYTTQATQTDDADNVGTSAGRTFTVDTAAPSVTNVALGGNNGTAGKDDTVTITFSEPMAATSFCSSWTGAGPWSLAGNGIVTVKISDSGTNDILTVLSTSNLCPSPSIGSIALGGNYVTADTTFGGNGSNASSVSLTPAGALSISLGSPSQSNSLRTNVTTGAPTYTPSGGLRDLAGNALPTASFTGGSTRF